MASITMEYKECGHCGARFKPPSNRSKTCSPICTLKMMSKPDVNGCWVWQGKTTKGGYGCYQINGVRTTAHRLSYMIYVGPIPEGLLVCHRCDVRSCINPDHLFVGSLTDNMIDCVRKGRNARKLTVEDVAAIRSAGGAASKAELGRRYGVTDVMIGKIIRGEWWKEFLPNGDVTLASSGKSPHTPST